MKKRIAAISPEVLVCLGVLAASWLGIIAQSPLPALTFDIGAIVGQLGVVGVLVWYLWYKTARADPKKDEHHSKEIEALRLAFAAEREADREANKEEIKTQRDADAQEKRELRSMVVQMAASMRTAVHDVRDTAQQTITKVAELGRIEGK